MTMTSGELERAFIDSVSGTTGKTLEQWLSLVRSSGIEKRMDILVWLKKNHGLPHLQAQLIAGIHLNNGNPVYNNETGLLETQFAGCAGMRKVFDAISARILSRFQGTQLIPKNNYLSYVAVREFALAIVHPGEIWLGLALGNEPFSPYLLPSNIPGSRPRFSHMLAMTSPEQLNDRVLAFISQSYKRTHNQ